MTTWGGPGTLNWTWTEKEWPRAAWRGSGRRMAAWRPDWFARETDPFIIYISSFGSGKCTWENSNRAAECGRKWMGASRLGRAGPTAVHRDGSSLYGVIGPVAGGPRGWKRSTYVGAQHRAGNGRPKVNGGHATGACWAPRAVHRDRCLHCMLLPQPPRGRHRGRQHARIIPVLVLAWRRWTESRCSRIGLPGPHKVVSSERQAAYWRLFPLIDGAALRAFLWFKI